MGEWKAEFELNTPEIEAEFDLDNPEICAEFSVNATVNDYNILENKPKINGEELVGDKSSSELHLVGETNEAKVIYGTDDEGNQILYREGEGISFNNGEISSTTSYEGKAYISLSKIKDYLYNTTYAELDYKYAKNWFKTRKPEGED